MKYLLSLIMLFTLCGCYTGYVQLLKAAPLAPVSTQGESYVFENDTVKIIYDFWAEKGLMSFSVYNKLKLPLYIDWRKSGFIQNDNKLDYWQDVETTTAQTDYKSLSAGISSSSAFYGATKGTANTTAVKTRPERITFIAPQTVIPKAQFEILPVDGIKMNRDEVRVYFTKANYAKDSVKKVAVIYRNYSNEESILRFRNFLTFSTTEGFANEFYVNNQFYIGRISTMTKKQFEDDKTQSYYPDSRYFYIHIPVEGSSDFDELFKSKKPEVAKNIWNGEWVEK